MSKSINFGLLLITLSTLHVSYKVIEGNVIPLESNIDLLNCLRNKVLERSNYYREKYNYQQFTLNAEMNNKAQQWANGLATSTMLTHDPNIIKQYGVNLAKIPTLVNLGERVVDLWFSFVALVDYRQGINGYIDNSFIGTLTQLLWRTSRQIGVGVSQNFQNDYYVVVYYDPPGNQLISYTSNLPILLKKDVIIGQNIVQTFTKEVQKNVLVFNPRLGISSKLPDEVSQYATPNLPLMFTSSTVSKGLRALEANSIRKQVLEKNNYYRRLHGLNNLIIKEMLNRNAQNTANQMAAGKDVTITVDIKSTINPRYGENKYKSPPTIFGNFGEVAVDIWYNQIRLLRENMYEREFLGKPETGCLTQMLWRSSVVIGVGVSVDDVGNYYLVVDYYPVGNVENAFLANLPKFTNPQISAGAQADELLTKISGRRTEFKLPRWNMVIKPEK